MSMKTRWWLVGVLGVMLVATQALAQGTRWKTYMVAGAKAFQQGRYDEAEKQFKAALEEAEKFGPEDVGLAVSLNKLAGVYHVQGKYIQAEPLLKRALAIWEKILGPEHINVAATLENYAALLRKTNRETEAAQMEARARVIRAKHAQENPKK